MTSDGQVLQNALSILSDHSILFPGRMRYMWNLSVREIRQNRNNSFWELLAAVVRQSYSDNEPGSFRIPSSVLLSMLADAVKRGSGSVSNVLSYLRPESVPSLQTPLVLEMLALKYVDSAIFAQKFFERQWSLLRSSGKLSQAPSRQPCTLSRFLRIIEEQDGVLPDLVCSFLFDGNDSDDPLVHDLMGFFKSERPAPSLLSEFGPKASLALAQVIPGLAHAVGDRGLLTGIFCWLYSERLNPRDPSGIAWFASTGAFLQIPDDIYSSQIRVLDSLISASCTGSDAFFVQMLRLTPVEVIARLGKILPQLTSGILIEELGEFTESSFHLLRILAGISDSCLLCDSVKSALAGIFARIEPSTLFEEAKRAFESNSSVKLEILARACIKSIDPNSLEILISGFPEDFAAHFTRKLAEAPKKLAALHELLPVLSSDFEGKFKKQIVAIVPNTPDMPFELLRYCLFHRIPLGSAKPRPNDILRLVEEKERRLLRRLFRSFPIENFAFPSGASSASLYFIYRIIRKTNALPPAFQHFPLMDKLLQGQRIPLSIPPQIACMPVFWSKAVKKCSRWSLQNLLACLSSQGQGQHNYSEWAKLVRILIKKHSGLFARLPSRLLFDSIWSRSIDLAGLISRAEIRMSILSWHALSFLLLGEKDSTDLSIALLNSNSIAEKGSIRVSGTDRLHLLVVRMYGHRPVSRLIDNRLRSALESNSLAITNK